MIRKINRFDYDQVLDLMLEFAGTTGLEEFRRETYDREYAKKVLLYCEKSGCSFVSIHDQEIQGVILSLRDRDIWIREVVRLKELAWFVRPKYRMTTIAARLFHAYKSAAQELLERGEITSFTMMKLHNSPDFDLEKRGFRYLESTFIVGE